MGNFDSKAKFEHGEVTLTLDQPHFYAGEKLTGNIHIELSQPYPAQSLYIKLKGKEKMYWKQGKHSHTSNDMDVWDIKEHLKWYKKTYDYDAKPKYIDRDVCIKEFDEPLLPGQHDFPFSVLIPNNIPSSTRFKGKNDSKAFIEYFITVMLKPNKNVKIKDLKLEKPLLIAQKPVEVLYDQVQTKEENIKKFAFVGRKGRTRLITKLAKNCIAPRETLNVKIDIDNTECGEDIKSVDITFEQHVKLGNKWCEFSDYSIIKKMSVEGVPRHTSTNGFKSYDIPLTNLIYRSLVNKPEDPSQKDFFSSLHPTAIGNEVNNVYIVKVKVNHNDWGFQNLESIMPVFVTPKPIQKEELDNKTSEETKTGVNEIVDNFNDVNKASTDFEKEKYPPIET